MEGFVENDDDISIYNSSELIEEVDDEDELEVESPADSDDDAKRFKTMTADESSFKMNVFNVLKESCAIVGVGDFAVSGKFNHPLIAIAIKNASKSNIAEYIKFPLQQHEVNNIIKLFEQSPYGKGTKTIVDTSVRNSFQLNPDGFEILNSSAWDKCIKTFLVHCIKRKMSLGCSFVPSLHKLLLYTPGSFFKPHRDSEKEDNMFGTLVIQLPSKFKGGQLVVRHDGKAKNFDFSSNELVNRSFNTFFSAFYCDCEHEILPVTEGYRLCLIYNLIATDTIIPVAPRNHALMELTALLQNWEGSRKLVYALTHKYSQSNLSLKNLKTTDKSVANILKLVAKACELNIYLALFEKGCSGDGYGDEDDNNCKGCASYFDDYNSDNEVSYELKQLISIVNTEILIQSDLDVDFAKEVIPVDCFSTQEPYRQYCEHTGNEGVQISKSYRCAAITFWPKKYTFNVLTTSNASQDLVDEFFLKEAEKYFSIGCNEETKRKIIECAKCVLVERYGGSSKEHLTVIVNTVIKFNDVELIENLIRSIVVEASDTFPLIINECEKYGWERFSTAIMDMFKVLSQKKAINILTLLLGNGYMNEEKNKLFYGLLHTTLDRFRSSHFLSHLILRQAEYKDVLEPFITAIMQLNDLELLQKVVNSIVPIHSDTIALLAVICEKHGWEPFATAIAEKFKKLSKTETVVNLTLLIENGGGILNEHKRTMCLNLFNILFTKTDELTDNTFHSYHREKSEAADIIKKKKAEKDLLEPLINAAMSFNSLQLIRNIFQLIVPLHNETMPLLIDQCEINGWNAFNTEIHQMFLKLSLTNAIEMLYLLIQIGNQKEQNLSLCSSLFQTILIKKDILPSNEFGSQDQKLKQQKDEQDILYTICLLAENIKFDLLSYAKTKSFKDFVPVLFRLVPKDATALNAFWGTVASHFIAELCKESSKVIQMSWRHAKLTDVCCNDCISLNAFLEGNIESQSFQIEAKRRKHLQQRLNMVEKIMHISSENTLDDPNGVLIVKKTEISDAEAIQDLNVSKSLLGRLRSIMPYK